MECGVGADFKKSGAIPLGQVRRFNGAYDYDRSGSKYTVAQAWSLGRNQPELRLYASYFDSDNDNWSDSSHAFEGDDSDDTWVVGVQANVWW